MSKNRTTIRIKYKDQNYYQDTVAFYASVRDCALCMIVYNQEDDWYEEKYIPLHRIDEIRIIGNNK